MKKKTLPSLRIDEKTYRLMELAIKKHNEISLRNVNLQAFRRISYETLSQMILQEKEIPVRVDVD